MLSYFCEDRATAFCKVINDSVEHYRLLDYVIILFVISWLAYSAFNFFNKLRSMDIRTHSAVDLLSLVLGKAGWLYLLGITGCFVYAVFAYIASFYSKHVGHGFSNDPAVWGQAGDFFGGMLNPFLAFCSFMALLYTIKIQTDELKLTREELKRSANAAQKSVEIEEENLKQQRNNLEEQFRIARYQQLMPYMRDKVDSIHMQLRYRPVSNGDSTSSYFSLEENFYTFYGELLDTREHEIDCISFEKLRTKCLNKIKIARGTPKLSLILQRLNRDLILAGRAIRELHNIGSTNEVQIFRNELQHAVGILYCCGRIDFRDTNLAGLSGFDGEYGPCLYDGFLDALKIFRKDSN
ncbi:MAG: hypothetical protein KKF22_05185 [Gammaproteobacteria bacterium]|nr:hypothetical protein [Gammaproteobacteria bacterium]